MRAGILEERTGTDDLVGEILRDPFITEDQKKTLIHIYQSFAAETRTARGEGEVDESVPETPAEQEDPSPAAHGASGNGHGPTTGAESPGDTKR